MSTSIEWTQESWNPAVGCERVSPGCDHCYAIGVAHRAMQPAHVGLTVTVDDVEREGFSAHSRRWFIDFWVESHYPQSFIESLTTTEYVRVPCRRIEWQYL